MTKKINTTPIAWLLITLAAHATAAYADTSDSAADTNALFVYDPSSVIDTPQHLQGWRDEGFQPFTLNDCNADPNTHNPTSGIARTDTQETDTHGTDPQRSKKQRMGFARCSLPALDSELGRLFVLTRYNDVTLLLAQARGSDKILADKLIVLADAQSAPTQHDFAAFRQAEIVFLADPALPTRSLAAIRKNCAQLRQNNYQCKFILVPDSQPDTFNTVRDKSLLRMLVAQAAEIRHPQGSYETMLGALYQWQAPPFNHDEFLQHPQHIQSYRFDDTLRAVLAIHFTYDQYQLKQFEAKTFLAFDLLKYLAEREDSFDNSAPSGFLSFTTLNGQASVIDLSAYAAFKPVIVIGIDDIDNLFRHSVFYRTKRMYSWKDTTSPEVATRLFGPFLHFLTPVPSSHKFALIKRSNIVFSSISYSRENPWKKLDALPVAVRDTITSNCIHCHRVQGVGGFAGHIKAKNAQQQGGYALPLKDYPLAVIKEFLFNQEAVAKKIGVNPNPMPADTAQALYDWLASIQHNAVDQKAGM